MQLVLLYNQLNQEDTRFVGLQTESLKDSTVKVLTGSCQNPEVITLKGAEIHIIEDLNYLERRKYNDKEAMVKLHQVHRKIRNHLTADTILHTFNLNLGENPIVTYAVYLLAKEGLRVVNHTHNFAEDRPENYTFLKEILSDIFLQRIGEVLYPQLPNYRYSVLNSFDFERLQKYGVQKERIELLPEE